MSEPDASESDAAALRESEDRLRRTIEGIDAIVVYRELGDEPLWFSDQMERILGYDPDAFDHFDDWNAIIHPQDLPACQSVWNAEPQTWNLEYRVRRADGAWVWVRDRGRRTPASNGRPGGVFSLITDVTELHQLAEEGRRAERLEAAADLAAGLAHHLNNILTAVVGNLSLAAGDETVEAARVDIAAAQAAAQRAALVVQQFREFAGRERLVPEVFDAAAAIDRFLPTARALAGPGTRIAVHHRARRALVRFDPGLLGRILSSVTVNAAEAMPIGGELRFETALVGAPAGPSGQPGSVRLTITDTGVGMEEDVVGHVFEPFFTTKHPAAGVGMSLAAAFGLVRQAGGRMEAISAPGAGTTIVIELPRVTGKPVDR